MNGIVKVILLAATTALPFATPVAADQDAQKILDAITVCQIPRTDPSQIVQRLIRDGWIPLGIPLSPNDRNGIAMAAIALDLQTAERVNDKTLQPIWKEFWARALKAADIAVGVAASDHRLIALRSPAINSYLLVEVKSDDRYVEVVCVLTVSQEQYRVISFYLRDTKPTPGAIRVIRDLASRAPLRLSQMHSREIYLVPDPTLIESRLGFVPDVSLVVMSKMFYRAKDVSP